MLNLDKAEIVVLCQVLLQRRHALAAEFANALSTGKAVDGCAEQIRVLDKVLRQFAVGSGRPAAQPKELAASGAPAHGQSPDQRSSD